MPRVGAIPYLRGKTCLSVSAIRSFQRIKARFGVLPSPRLNSNVCCPSRSVRPIPFAGVHLMASARKFGILRFLKMTLRLASVGLFATLAGQAQTYTIVHSFAGKPNDGAFANGEVTQDSAGNFYGTTEEGGTDEDGSVFSIDPNGGVTTFFY